MRRWGFAVVLAVLFLVSCSQAFAGPATGIRSTMAYQRYIDVARGLHPQEAKKLQEIFDRYQVINLDRSGLPELATWVETL